MNVCGFFWLQNMLMTFSGFPAPVCFLFVLIVCAYQGSRVAFLGWVYGRATARGWPPAAVFAAAFVTSELVYPLLFPWYYAATVHAAPGADAARRHRRPDRRRPRARGGKPRPRRSRPRGAPKARARARARRRRWARALHRARVRGAPHSARRRCGRERARSHRRRRPGEHGPDGEANRLQRRAAAPSPYEQRAPRPRRGLRRVERDIGDARGSRRHLRRGGSAPSPIASACPRFSAR